MLRNVTVGNGVNIAKDSIITSGTGSGKTEAFLLPLIASLCKEAANWPENVAAGNEWWENNNITHNSWKYQREGENRPAAVRAMILYPMNALVEDQLSRLRRALDSDSVRTLLSEQLKGNKIYFGRYNSAAPNTKEVICREQGEGEPNAQYNIHQQQIEHNLEELQQYMESIQKNQQKIEAHIQAENIIDRDKKDELKSIFPRNAS
jgi:Lhr-like helicase